MEELRTSPFSIADALRFGWYATRNNLRPFLTIGLIGGVLGLVQQALTRPVESSVWTPLVMLALHLYQALLFMAMLRASLELYDRPNEQLKWPADMLSNFFSYLLTSALVTMIVAGGLALLIVPGVLWALRFGFAPLLTVDSERDAIEALRESSRLTAGARNHLLKFGVVALGINLLGAFALGVGLLFTVPVTTLAAAYVLRHLQESAADARARAVPTRWSDSGARA